MMAARIANLEKGGAGGSKIKAGSDVECSTSVADAGKMLSVSRDLVIFARRIYEHGTPEEIAAAA
jgi:hypothetical protein